MSKGDSKRWMHQHVTDPYVKQAQKEGLRSRAAFKLREIQEKTRLIKAGDWVLELGAAPGGWTELLVGWVRPAGRVVALDLLPMAPVPGVSILQGDIQDPQLLADLDNVMEGRLADVVLSDMAPNLTGNSSVDKARCGALWDITVELAAERLKLGGSFCIKVFHGPHFEQLLKNLRAQYTNVQIYKPKASRARSSEVYLIAKGKRKEG